MIFNDMQHEFQKANKEGKLNWESHREQLFYFKKTMDKLYRNMMYHFTHAKNCSKCSYWDDVYLKHLAKVDTHVPTGEVTDEEMLSVAESMEVDGTH